MDKDVDLKKQRAFPRYPLEFKVSYTLLSSMDATPFEYGETITQDISQSGACLLTKEKVQVPILIQLNIQIPSRKYGIIVLGKTVWCSLDEQIKQYRVGVKFVGLLPPDLGLIIKKDKIKK